MTNKIVRGGSAFEIYNNTSVKPAKGLAEGLLQPGFTILAGREKVGKTNFVTQVVLSISQGKLLFDNFNTKKTDVLFISLEESHELVKHRLRRLCPDAPPPDNIQYEFDWPEKGGFEWLYAYLEHNQETGLVVIDTLVKFTGGKLGRNYAEESHNASQFVKLIQDTGVSLIALHHTSKNAANTRAGNTSALYGSSGYSGAADNISIFDVDKARGIGRLMTNSRYGDSAFGFKFNKTLGVWEFIGELEACDLTPERLDILEVLAGAFGPLPVKMISKEVGKKGSALSNLLKKLQNQGFIKTVLYGIYEITDSGKNALAGQIE